MKKIRILHYIPGFDYGGIESLVIGMHNSINKELFEFDFLTEKEISDTIKKQMDKGTKIYQIKKITLGSCLKYIFFITNLLKKNNYDVIHIHDGETRVIVSVLSKIFGIKVRILHAHSADFMKKDKMLIRKIFRKISRFNSNYGIACSHEALKFMFGEKTNKQIMILNNGIDCKKFVFNSNNREKIRNKYNIKNEIIIGNIARFSYLKNQNFLVELLKELIKIKCTYKFILMFVGDRE